MQFKGRYPVTLRYTYQLAHDMVPQVEAIIKRLHPRWEESVPVCCRYPDGVISRPAIAHAILHLLNPARFPASRRTAILADCISLSLR